MRAIKSILILSLLCASPKVFAQQVFRYEIVGGVSINTLSLGTIGIWGDGWTIGGGVAFPVSPAIDLTASATYSSFSYPRNTVRYYNVERVGYSWDVSGEASSVIEGSIGARIIGPISSIKLFLSPRVGLYAVNIGTVTAAEWLTAKPQNPIHYIYPWSGVSTINGFAALGLGVSIPIDSRIRMMLESRFSQSSSGGESFVPILATMQFDVGV